MEIFAAKWRAMKIKYFPDTDTALLEFSKKAVAETREVSEMVYVDLDAAGHFVTLTIEHAKQSAGLPKVAVEEILAR
jgi:uncharacterized protein YuzE